MRTRKLHPLVASISPRFDILYGGTAPDAQREVRTIIRQAHQTLPADQGILYINSIDAFEDVEAWIDETFKRGRDRVSHITAPGTKLNENFAFVERLIERRNIRLLILNPFEFAALNSRHRTNLVDFLRWTKNKQKVQIVIVTLGRPNNIGLLGALRYMAESVSEIGSWLTAAPALDIALEKDALMERVAVDFPNHAMEQDAVAIARGIEQLDPAKGMEIETFEPAPEAIPEGMTEYQYVEEQRRLADAKKNAENIAEEVEESKREIPISDNAPLKNNDLPSENVRVVPPGLGYRVPSTGHYPGQYA